MDELQLVGETAQHQPRTGGGSFVLNPQRRLQDRLSRPSPTTAFAKFRPTTSSSRQERLTAAKAIDACLTGTGGRDAALSMRRPQAMLSPQAGPPMAEFREHLLHQDDRAHPLRSPKCVEVPPEKAAIDPFPPMNSFDDCP